MLDKNQIVEKLIFIYKEESEKLNQIIQDSKKYINESDMKQEGKYDTRAIEAGYLAGAQRKRLAEIKIDIALLEKIQIVNNKQRVVVSSIVHCLINNEKEDMFFISPSTGGINLQFGENSVHIVSQKSPLGEAILSMENGDYFEVESPKGEIEYQILDLF